MAIFVSAHWGRKFALLLCLHFVFKKSFVVNRFYMYSLSKSHDGIIHSDELTSMIEAKLKVSKHLIDIEDESKSSTESESDFKFKSSFGSTDTISTFPYASQNFIQLLECSNSKEEKLFALKNILQLQFDLPHNWDVLKVLQECLNSTDDEIFDASLEIHEKLIYSSWETLNDAFVNLLETLYVYYFSVDTEINTNRYPFKNMFKIYTLILATLNDVFMHSATIGNSRLEKIIGNYVDLVFFSTSIHESWSPLKIISCLDPAARWCKVLLHKANTRTILLKCVKHNSHFLKNIFLIISEWMHDPFVPTVKTVCSTTVKYVTFIMCLRCCIYMSKFRSFYNLFPVIISNRTIISCKSFIASLISFLKLRSQTPAVVTNCMIECVVCMVKFQPTDMLLLRLQLIIDELNERHRKYLFEIVRRILEDDEIMCKLTSYLINVRGTSPSGKLLKRMNSTNNIFSSLVYLLKGILQNSDGTCASAQALHIVVKVFEHHDFLIVCGLDNYELAELVQIVASIGVGLKSTNAAICNENNIFALGYTPMGFYYLAKVENLMKAVIQQVQAVQMPWLFGFGKKMVPFLVVSEFQQNVCPVNNKISNDILKLLNQVVIEDNKIKELEFREKIFSGVDVLSYDFHGSLSLFNYAREDCEIRSFTHFIEKYALASNHEHEMQYFALQLLCNVINHDFGVRIHLLSVMDYEECLLKLQNDCSSENYAQLRKEIITGCLSYHCSSASVNRFTKGKHYRRQLSDIEKFLQKTKHGPYDYNWLRHARTAYRNSMMYDIKLAVSLELLEKCAKSFRKTFKQSIQHVSAQNDTLNKNDHLGISLVVRYAIRNGIFHRNQNNEENLAKVMRTVREFTDYHGFGGFDCVLATLFIMCEGSTGKCIHMVSCILSLPISAYIWPQVTPSSSKKRHIFGHLLEWTLHQEVPKVFCALSNYGISWWLVCKNQLDNCFWNTMSWLEICRLFCCIILHSADNLIYYFTSVAYKNENRILETVNGCELRTLLHMIFSFHQLEDHLAYMDCLSRKYNLYLNSVLSDF